MILRHRVSSCAELLGFKLGELGNRFPTTCAASRPVSNRCASASWEGRSQLPLISFAGSRAVAQLQVGNVSPDSNPHNLILASNPRALAVISSCGGETHPYRVGRRTPSASAGVSSSHGPFGKVRAPSASQQQEANHETTRRRPRTRVCLPTGDRHRPSARRAAIRVARDPAPHPAGWEEDLASRLAISLRRMRSRVRRHHRAQGSCRQHQPSLPNPSQSGTSRVGRRCPTPQSFSAPPVGSQAMSPNLPIRRRRPRTPRHQTAVVFHQSSQPEKETTHG